MKDNNKRNSSVSRGYAGYFGEWYLRSLLEYKVARYVKLLENKFDLLAKYEPDYLTFNINGKNYKPDFYLYKNGKIHTIIEVKSNKESAFECIARYYDFFKVRGVKYRVIYSSYHFDKISKKCGITSKDILDWKNNSIYDYSGKNNPAYGLKWSNETKEKIGIKTKERCQSTEYMIKFKKSIADGMTAESRNRISIARKKLVDINQQKFNNENPVLEHACHRCGNIYSKRDIHDTNFQIYGFRSCSKGCTQKLKLKNGILTKLNKKWDDLSKSSRFKKTLINQGYKILMSYNTINENIISISRCTGIISRNSQLSIYSIEKYFHTLDNFLKELVNGSK